MMAAVLVQLERQDGHPGSGYGGAFYARPGPDDIHASFARRPAAVDLIVRAAQDRALHDGASLFAAAAGWPELARTGVLVAPSRTGVRGRVATVALRAGPVVICRPRHSDDPSARRSSS